MKLNLVLFLSIWVGINSLYASEAKSKVIKKIFKSDMGYEITYPDCMIIAPNSADDLEKKVEILDSIVLGTFKCPDKLIFGGNKTFYAIEKINFRNLSFQDALRNRKEGAIRSESIGGAKYILSYDPPEEQKKVYKLLTIEHTGYLRWKFYIPCKKQMFVFSIMTKNDILVTDELKGKLKRIDFSDLKTEMSIVDSFRCTN